MPKTPEELLREKHQEVLLREKHQEVFNEWFEWHNKKESSVKSKKWHVIKLEHNKRFYLSERVMEIVKEPEIKPHGYIAPVPYKIILGYYSDNDTLKARIWYFSGSEANWRAFTGFRPGGGAWMKGYEVKTDVNYPYTLMGYIFECFTTVEFSKLLSIFWNQSECNYKFYSISPWKGANPAPKSASYPVYQYVTSEEHRPAGIAADWNKERIFSLANLPAGVTEDADKLSKQVSSVHIQKSYDFTKNPGMRTGVGHVFKKDIELNTWLLRCLDNKISETQLNHPVLNDDYIVTTFRLPGNVVGTGSGCGLNIEIAASCHNREHRWYDFTADKKSLNTRVCWVRDVYYMTTPTTSFGTRKEIPINLAFLVQKPCDYNSQVSKDYMKKVSPHDAVNMVGGKYIILSMLNEATSRLIKDFKEQKGYPCFRGKYHRPKDILPDRPEIVQASPDYQSEEAFLFFQELVILGINEYICIHSEVKNKSVFGSGGFHGGSGIERAMALSSEVKACKTTGDLSKKLYTCFIENRIGTFTGGWSSKIRTNPTSLFTCVCRYLLAPFVVDALESSAFQQPVPARWDKDTILKDKSGLDGIARMAEYVRNDSLVNIKNRSEGQYITDVAANILVVLRG